MCRKNLLEDICNTLKILGFIEGANNTPLTYQRNVKYPSIFADKSDYAHFVVYTPKRAIQIVAKYQETSGTAIEKLAYTAMDASRSQYDDYVVVCGGSELLKNGRAIDFLNDQKEAAPKITALKVQSLAAFLAPDLGDEAA